MDDSSEINLIKIAVVLVALVLLFTGAIEFYKMFTGRITDLQQKEIENRKKQNQSIGCIYEYPNELITVPSIVVSNSTVQI